MKRLGAAARPLLTCIGHREPLAPAAGGCNLKLRLGVDRTVLLVGGGRTASLICGVSGPGPAAPLALRLAGR